MNILKISKKQLPLVVAISVAMLGMSFSLFTKFFDTQKVFQVTSQKLSSNIVEQLNSAAVVLEGMTAYIQSVDQINNEELTLYVENILFSHTQIYALEYAVRVLYQDKERFEAEQRNKGFSSYRIKLSGASQSDEYSDYKQAYYPVVFIEPFTPSTVKILGFDLSSETMFSQAIFNAVKSGDIFLSEPFFVNDGNLAYALFKTAYLSQKTPASAAERYRQGTRIAKVVVNFSHIFQQQLPVGYSVRFVHPQKENLLYELHGQEHDPLLQSSMLPMFNKKDVLSLYGKRLAVEYGYRLSLSDLPFSSMVFSLIAAVFIYYLLKMTAEVRGKSLSSLRRTDTILDSIDDAVLVCDLQGQLAYYNPSAQRLFRWPFAPESVFDILHRLSPTSLGMEKLRSAIQKGESFRTNEPLFFHDFEEKELHLECEVTPVENAEEDMDGVIVTLHDVTNVKQLMHQVSFQASHDHLTGLFNRAEFERQIMLAASSAKKEGRHHALLYMDLDQFNIVNDTSGHIAGDTLLMQVARSIRKELRESDILARLGGDEFGAILHDCDLDHAERVANKVREELQHLRFVWEDKHFDVGISIGVVAISQDSQDAQEILRHADSACYISKEHGRNCVHVFYPDDEALTQRHGELQWIQRINYAINNNRLRLASQPITPINSEERPHRELLLRMLDDDGSIIPPMSFIPAAERYDLMTALDRWVIDHAFAQISERLDGGISPYVYNINLSGQSIGKKEFRDFVLEKLQSQDFPGQTICFELTETAAIANLNVAIEFMRQMKIHGVLFALDDFGSGLSSFSYLRNLPIDYLKIDGIFIKDVINQPIDAAMVRAIQQVAEVMGIETVAEYVEDEATIELLRELGIGYIQGFAVQRPRLMEPLLAS